MQIRTWQSVAMGMLLATTVACGNRNSQTGGANGSGSESTSPASRGAIGTSNTSDTTGTSGSLGAVGTAGLQNSTTQNAPVRSGNGSLTGCLQRGNGTDYILTQINAPSIPVGTRDSSGTADHARASGSYVLKGSDEQFKSLVGRQVHVVGTASDTASNAPAGSSAAATDRSNASRSTVSAVMPEFRVTSISQVSASCAPAGKSGTAGSNDR